MKKFWSEFREFAMKGSMIDLAIGVIIGGAFSTVVTSLVNDILMPLLSLLIGHVSIKDLKVTVPSIIGDKPIVLAYGNFLQTFLNFFIIALFIFLIIRAVNRLRDNLVKLGKSGTAEEVKPEPPTPTETLLAEICDLLKEERESK